MTSRGHPFFHQKKKKRFQKFLFKGALLPCAFKIIQRLLKNIKVCGRRACLQYNRSNTFLDKYFFSRDQENIHFYDYIFLFFTHLVDFS